MVVDGCVWDLLAVCCGCLLGDCCDYTCSCIVDCLSKGFFVIVVDWLCVDSCCAGDWLVAYNSVLVVLVALKVVVDDVV